MVIGVAFELDKVLIALVALKPAVRLDRTLSARLNLVVEAHQRLDSLTFAELEHPIPLT